MVARNEEFAASGYTTGPVPAFSFAALIKRVAAILQDFGMRMQREQAEAKLRLERKRQMQEDLRRQTIKGSPLEELIKMGFRHF